MRHHFSREQVDALVAHTGSASAAREVFRILGAVSGAAYLAEDEQIRFAHRLLSTGTPRPEIARRLVARFGFTQRTAYRKITQAQKQPLEHHWSQAAT